MCEPDSMQDVTCGSGPQVAVVSRRRAFVRPLTRLACVPITRLATWSIDIDLMRRFLSQTIGCFQRSVARVANVLVARTPSA